MRATGEAYTIPPRFRLEKFLKDLQPRQLRHDQRKEKVRLRFDARVAPLICDAPGTIGQTMQAVSDGTIELLMTVETVEHIVPWVLGFGDQVEVVEPEELKDAICERARRIVRRYENRPA